MTEDTARLLERITALEALVAELVRLSTPQGRFEAEQAYVAFRQRTNPLYLSRMGNYTDDELTQKPNIARMLPRHEHLPSDEFDGSKGT